MLRTRVRSALLFGPAAILVVGLGGWWTFAGMLAVAWLCAYEFQGMMKHGGHSPSLPLMVVIIAIPFAQAALPQLSIARPALLFFLLVSLALHLLRAPSSSPTVDWALVVAGGLYLGWLTAHFVYLRWLPDGLAWITAAVATTWLSDSGAYFVGRSLGRHKLCPQLSPSKTWEGLLGGVLAGLLGGTLVGGLLMVLLGDVGWLPGLALGGLVSILAPLGDLTISMMKREVDVKDCSNLIPGHGGILDRMDSLLFVVPATYYLVAWWLG